MFGSLRSVGETFGVYIQTLSLGERNMRKKLLVAALSSAIICVGAHVSASSNFFADVPADDWSYSAVNELISTGKVPGYTEKIPDGRIMSRLEMEFVGVQQ